MASNPSPPPITPSALSKTPTATISSLGVPTSTELTAFSDEQLSNVVANWRASCFIAAAQIFLRNNALQAEHPLEYEDIKPRLLGHWGTTGGLSLVYAHASALIARKEKAGGEVPKILFVTGPGHGAPAILSSLFIEGSISHFYPQWSSDRTGLDRFVRDFSWPGGLPSHVNAQTPGSIHEGGELGYSLAVSYGSVMDSPDVITVCVVGDGESETGPTAAAWHAHKFIDPKESGAVIPVLHVNGFKISERTLPGTMDNTELELLYSGYGYQVCIVEYEPVEGEEPHSGGGDKADRLIHHKFANAMEWAYSEIRAIQKAARVDNKPIAKPRWPMIVLRSPKGWTGPNFDASGKQMLNSFASHQIPLPKAASDKKSLGMMSDWLKSYEPEKLFNFDSSLPLFKDCILDSVVPVDSTRKMGQLKESYGAYTPLELDDWKPLGYKRDEEVGAMQATAEFLKTVVAKNPHTFRIFSPDELESNKLHAVLEVTHRNLQSDPATAHDGGRVIEMLSEHTLQGFLQGYTLTGRHGILPSYESFLGIVTTMLIQFGKFSSQVKEVNWRKDLPSVTYIETSTWTRQEHNGFSHQNPGFIATVLQLPVSMARVYFPADGNTALSIIHHCLKSKNYCNLVVGAKHPSKVFLSVEEADKHCLAGVSTWEEYSTDKGADPDVVLVGIGFELTSEVIAAANLLRKKFNDQLRVRVVNVVDLLVLSADHPHALDESAFNSLFPPKTPVVWNYHGYRSQLAGLLFDRSHSVGRKRFQINAYSEQGTTTTPFSMLRVNKCGRFDVACQALEYVVYNMTVTGNITAGTPVHERLSKILPNSHSVVSEWQHQNVLAKKYAEETQQDHPKLSSLEANLLED